MNKLNILIAGLMVFAAVAQIVRADEELVNELSDDEDIDDELEGGPGGFISAVKSFTSPAAKPVGVNVEDLYGRDIQNPKIGQATFAESRQGLCRDKKNELACSSCCKAQDKSYRLSGRLRSHCTCISRDNNYSKLPVVQS